MPILSVSGETIDRNKTRSGGTGQSKRSKKKKKVRLINQTPKHIPKKKTTAKTKRNKITETQAKYITDIREAERLRRLFKED